MTDCRLSISSRGNGWESNTVQSAKLSIDGDWARVEYKIDGDDCTFELCPARAEQVRRGSVNIRMAFVPGGKTACILGDDDIRGGYDIFTTRLDCTIKSHGFNAVIEYLSGDDRERICVKLRALALGK